MNGEFTCQWKSFKNLNDNNNHNNHHTIQSPKKNPRWDPVASETSVENSENSSLRHAGDQLVVLVCRLGGHLHRPVFLVLVILIIFKYGYVSLKEADDLWWSLMISDEFWWILMISDDIWHGLTQTAGSRWWRVHSTCSTAKERPQGPKTSK